MRNKDKWVPSKFVYKMGKLVASRNKKEVQIGSRLMVNLVASFYDENIKVYAKGKLIDLGCGKVPLYETYKDCIVDNICVDWENTFHGNEFLDFTCDLTKRLPLHDGEFDTIILSDVLEHIPQPENLWEEMSRILSMSGNLIINVPFYYKLHETPHDYYRYTEYALRRFAKLSGFKIKILQPIGGSPEVLADILAKHFQFIPLLGNLIALIIQNTAYAFVRGRLGKMLSKKTRKAFPFGYFLVAEKNRETNLTRHCV